MRLSILALSAVVIATGACAPSVALAQGKKKPKKPKTEEPAAPEGQKPKDAHDNETPPSTDPPDKPPPPIDTDLKEQDTNHPGGATNPWVTSGLAKRKDGSGATSFESSDSGGDPKKRRKEENAVRPISVGVFGGYASENLRIGFGIRAGYSILNQIYIGAGFVYHLGTTAGDFTARVFYPGLELGYDLHIDQVSVRLYAGGGFTFVTVSGGDKSETSDGYLTLYPGLSIDFQIPDTPAFVGIDGRVVLIVDSKVKDSDPSIGVFGLAGARF